jgi:hypothetical protein
VYLVASVERVGATVAAGVYCRWMNRIEGR